MGASADTAAEVLNNIKNSVPEDIGKGIQDYLASGNFESMG